MGTGTLGARILAAFLVCALVSITTAAWAAKPDKKKTPAAAPRLDDEGIYAMTMTRGETGLHIVEYWSKGATLRAHTTLSGRPFITLVRGNTYTLLDPVAKRGVSIARSPRALEQDTGKRRLFGNEFVEMLKKGAERIRTEDTPFGPLDVYRLTDDDGRRTVWVTADEYQLPMKFETFDRTTGAEARLEYLSWSPLHLPDAFFDAPTEGWTIERVASYDEWLKAPATEPFKQAPIIFPLLLHGRP